MHNFVLYIKNQSMKKLLLILSISTLAISCKKDKLYNCLEGRWYSDDYDYINIIDGKIELENNVIITIDKNGNCKYSNGVSAGNITYNGESAIWINNGITSNLHK